MIPWKLPFGATPDPEGVHFRLWAPDAAHVDVVVNDGPGSVRHVMHRGSTGYHDGFVPGLTAGAQYQFAVDDLLVPDPASRSQPGGVHGPSEIIDAAAFAWSDGTWAGLDRERLVIYELHVGTFTSGGTFDAAIERLDDLSDLGVNAIEVMPIASFSGTRNWGYDGVALFAPSANYGGPCAFKRFVNAAHERGLGVILDVVYNHFGPDGNYLPAITGGRIFNPRHQTAWGNAVNYDGPDCGPVRELVLQNAQYWAHEYHVDGLRIDAAHAIVDDSPVHILREIAEHLHQLAPARLVILEDDRNERRLLLSPGAGGLGCDAVWADDLHHQLRRLVSGDTDGYFGAYRGTVADVATTLRKGWFYEGQWSDYHGAPRGTPADGLPPSGFVHCIQNHDQVGNRALGDRIHHTIPASAYRALSTLLLLSPYTPLLWMGQEWGATSPFQFFTDFAGDLGHAVTEGRRREFATFAAFSDATHQCTIPDPQAESTFVASRLRWDERDGEPHRQLLALYRDLLSLRSTDPALARSDRSAFAVSDLDENTLALRRESGNGDVLIAVVRFAEAARSLRADHPVLQLASGFRWQLVLSTEEPRFGGAQRESELTESGALSMTGLGAVVLRAVRDPEVAHG